TGKLAAPLLSDNGDAAAESVSGWVELPPFPAPAAFPEGVHPPAGKIGAPATLGRRLGQAGWVDSEDAGWQLQPRLQPGQSLVDRDGRLWRWDGFTRLAAGSSTTAEQLRQRNRLAALSGEIAAATAASRAATKHAAAARGEREAAAYAERAAIEALRAGEERLSRARAAEAELTRRGLAAETRLAALDETIDKLGGELTELAGQSAETERTIALLPAPELARTALETARAQAAGARRREAEARAVLDRLAREDEARRQRIAAIGDEDALWQKRRDSAAAQRAILQDRQQALSVDIAELTARPAAIAAETEALARSAAAAAAQQRDAGDALALGETPR